MISLILCWLSAGFHLGVSVGIGDFCTAPHTYFLQLGFEEPEKKDIIQYYIKCDSNVSANPFKTAFPNIYDNAKKANESFTQAVQSLIRGTSDVSVKEEMKGKAQQIFSEFDNTIQTLMHLNALIECTNIHKDYIDGIKGICHHGL